jgi:hypothetical protein
MSPRGSSGRIRYIRCLGAILAASFGILQPIALAVHLNNMAAVSQPVENCAGKPFRSQNFSPVLKGQVRGYDDACPLICRADDVKRKREIIPTSI